MRCLNVPFPVHFHPIFVPFPSIPFQTCGASTFHFLPLLVGLYATHVGRQRGPAALAALLDELGARGIGEDATIGPQQMLLILPFGAHGVFVPRPRDNPSLPPFEVSLIRAAEIYISPVYDLYERRLRDDGWSTPLPLTEEEWARDAALLAQFSAAQERVCAELGVTRQDWFYLATCLQQRWDAERPPPAAEEEEES